MVVGLLTSHLSLKNNCELYKIGKEHMLRKRDYGYGVSYRNLGTDDILKLENIMITVIDKHYWQYLHLFPEGQN